MPALAGSKCAWVRVMHEYIGGLCSQALHPRLCTKVAPHRQALLIAICNPAVPRCFCSVLCLAAYPFWPLMHLVASAAVQLPNDPETTDATDDYQHDIQVLMLHRRGAMLDAYSQMFGDHSTPGERMVE